MIKSIILRLDEVSMISNVLFNTIQLRLDDIFPQNSALSFGGQNMLLFGDFLQVLIFK